VDLVYRMMSDLWNLQPSFKAFNVSNQLFRFPSFSVGTNSKYAPYEIPSINRKTSLVFWGARRFAICELVFPNESSIIIKPKALCCFLISTLMILLLWESCLKSFSQIDVWCGFSRSMSLGTGTEPGPKDLFRKRNPKVKMKKEVSGTLLVVTFYAWPYRREAED
jgi:hypothetical protein